MIKKLKLFTNGKLRKIQMEWDGEMYYASCELGNGVTEEVDSALVDALQKRLDKGKEIEHPAVQFKGSGFTRSAKPKQP